MSDLGDLTSSLGHEPDAPQWRTTSNPPVTPDRFGRDHWSTFAYVETRTVDHRGTLNHDHMRCHGRRHPMMLQAKSLRGLDAVEFPTILAGGEESRDHDDYDCIDDLIAAGLLEAHMPSAAAGFHVGSYFVDAYDKPLTDIDGALIQPDYLTGMDELRLCAFATFSLTEKGKRVASDLRAHRAGGGTWATFRAECGGE